MAAYLAMVELSPGRDRLYTYEEPVCLSEIGNTEAEAERIRAFWNRIAGGCE
jgi:hypothetical protein